MSVLSSLSTLRAGLLAILLPQASKVATTSVTAAAAPTASAYATNSDGTYQLTPITAPVKGSTTGSGTIYNLTIDDTSTGFKQNITGFGAAVTDATVISISSLSSDKQSQLLNQLMTLSGSTSAGLNMMRHTIGSSDLSPVEYTYDDSTSPDVNLTRFDIGSYGTSMANLLARMKSLNSNLFVLGTAWSAPGWMKRNLQIDHNGTANNRLSDHFYEQSGPDYSEPFAQYFVKYLQAFQNKSVNVDAIAIQNEPLNNQAGYPTMNVAGPEAASLIKNHVGPALSAAGLKTVIWGNEDNTGPQGDIDNAQFYLNSTSGYVKTIAWHCYYAPNGYTEWAPMTDFYTKNKGVSMFMSECNTPAPVDGGHWYGAANFTIGPLQNWAGGSMAWTLSTNSSNGPYLSKGGCTDCGCTTCRGLVTVNNATSYTLNIAYYNIAQFSRFMPRGARVLSGTGSSAATGVQHIGTLNPDGTRSVVVLNTRSDSLFVNLKTGSGETWGGNIPALSIVTWVLPKSS